MEETIPRVSAVQEVKQKITNIFIRPMSIKSMVLVAAEAQSCKDRSHPHIGHVVACDNFVHLLVLSHSIALDESALLTIH